MQPGLTISQLDQHSSDKPCTANEAFPCWWGAEQVTGLTGISQAPCRSICRLSPASVSATEPILAISPSAVTLTASTYAWAAQLFSASFAPED